MRIGILGSGEVGRHLAAGFLASGHQVKIGTRNPTKLAGWLQSAGNDASVGSFSEAAQFGELVALCTKWTGTENALSLAGKHHFAGKAVIDATNPLLFESEGQPPTLALGYPDSAGATIQKWLPESMVVKAFNMVPAHYMDKPLLQEGKPDLFIAGNDAAAKKTASGIAEAWGWAVTDIGGRDQAYLLEAIALLWIRYGFLNKHWTHAFKLLRK